MQILIAEDDTEIRNVLDVYFAREGWEVDTTGNGHEALQKYDYKKHDLVILDLKLEGLEGEKVCTMIREKSNVPVIMLTSKSLESDIIHGFNLGADDYVVKPFRVKEVVARVKAVARRVSAKEASPVVSFDNGALKIDFSCAEAVVEGRRVKLTNTEFKLLSVLMKEPLKVYSRSELMYKALGYRAQEDGRISLDVHVKNLRKKIEKDSRRPKYVETVIGMGYRFAVQPDT
ncbi:response regulator transcription factor [Paenibacillus lemnae]|uniref:Response regulator transcription factor n=1 Tax=Paenibacillus lemnae TaxID=1330551 RepID=A0A848M224_PAELE|nr:response regulator transcription factor [Paenibacillus lemnae]NMO94616.1 response regulator transcription factor [Paenibacillus lemnae]